MWRLFHVRNNRISYSHYGEAKCDIFDLFHYYSQIKSYGDSTVKSLFFLLCDKFPGDFTMKIPWYSRLSGGDSIAKSSFALHITKLCRKITKVTKLCRNSVIGWFSYWPTFGYFVVKSPWSLKLQHESIFLLFRDSSQNNCRVFLQWSLQIRFNLRITKWLRCNAIWSFVTKQ